jgi:hypothetical protein
VVGWVGGGGGGGGGGEEPSGQGREGDRQIPRTCIVHLKAPL